MPSQVKLDTENKPANTQPKKMTNAEIWLKILADQKLIREELQKGTSFQELKDKYGFVFKTV